MPDSRAKNTEEAFLHELSEIHMSGKEQFLPILTRIRSSPIRRKHRELREAIMDDAKGFRMVNHREVIATLDYIKGERVKTERNRGTVVTPRIASVGGYAL